METPREYYYTYYSYEEWGRGYFGSRKCYCLPEEDINYFGSFKDKTFKPKYKIILKDNYTTREEAYADEIILHDYYDVANNPHFANRAKQTSARFCVSREQAIENGKKSSKKCKEHGRGIFSMTSEELSNAAKKGAKIGGKKGSETQRKLKSGIFGLTDEERKDNGKKGAKTQEKLGIGLYGLSKEQRIENGKKYGSNAGKIGGKKSYDLGVGVHSLTTEERREIGRISGNKCKELGVGIFSLSKEELSLYGKKGGRKGAKSMNSQKWKCLETGFVTNPGNLTKYQKARGIDTSKRIRIE
jgi:hypothetical protein